MIDFYVIEWYFCKIKMRNVLFLGLIICLAFAACKKETETYTLKGGEYVTDKVGRIKIYRVDSVVFNINTTFPEPGTYTSTHYEKHQITHIEKDSSGKPYFYTLVSISTDQKFYFDAYAYKTQLYNFNYEKVLNNVRTILLNFPVETNRSWDGNLYNSAKGASKFKYVENDEFVKPDKQYDNQIIIKQQKDILPITESNAYFEVYAPQKGLVYSLKYYNDKQNNGGALSESGYYLHSNLIYFE